MDLKKLTKAELIKYITELEAKTGSAANAEETEKLKNALELKTRAVSLLKEVVEMSCKDHCPHHAMVEACRNCAIKKKMLELAASEK